MINIKAEDFGLKPNVTGFEEAVNLLYMDAWREGFCAAIESQNRFNYNCDVVIMAKNYGVKEEIISKATGLDLDTIRKLK